jgi:3D (Asp-Asp-Asp) domain-containing protein
LNAIRTDGGQNIDQSKEAEQKVVAVDTNIFVLDAVVVFKRFMGFVARPNNDGRNAVKAVKVVVEEPT